MKLEIIEYVEEAMDKISADSFDLDIAKRDIEMLLEGFLREEDYYLNVISRVKSPQSVKEKILKQDLYKKYDTVDGLLNGISDIVGIRIECRFIHDEEKVYNRLVELFDIHVGKGFYTCMENKKVALKLDEPQPQYQKNGFEIYKIDGHYIGKDTVYNFELQIKSLVNNFWGDIEHRILYKNYNYLLSETFIKDMMGSIKENLTLIDKQLRVVYDHVFNLQTNRENGVEQIKDIIKKMTYDIYFYKIRTQLGFVVDFRSIVDLIVEYVFMKENGEGQKRIGKDFLDLLKKLSGTLERQQNFDEVIELPRKPVFKEKNEIIIGKHLVDVINKDFRWNVFFRIVFDIEEGDKTEVLEDFVRYLRIRFENIAKCSVRQSRFAIGNEDEASEFILDAIIESFIRDLDAENLDEKTLISLKQNIQGYLLGIISWEEWEQHKAGIREGILSFKAE